MKDFGDRMSLTESYNTARNIDLIKSIRGTMTDEEQKLANERARFEVKVYLVFFAIIGAILLLSNL